MNNNSVACVQATFRNIAEGKVVADTFGTMIQSAIRLNLTSKDAVAGILGVQPAQVFGKANALKPAEIKDLCRKLAL